MIKKDTSIPPATVTEFLDTQYGDTLDSTEKAQCRQAIIEFVGVLLEINQQKGIIHADSE